MWRKVSDWCVLAETNTATFQLLSVVPRRPNLSDFHDVYQMRQTKKEQHSLVYLKCALVHESVEMSSDHRDFLRWLSSLADIELALVDQLLVQGVALKNSDGVSLPVSRLSEVR